MHVSDKVATTTEQLKRKAMKLEQIIPAAAAIAYFAYAVVVVP